MIVPAIGIGYVASQVDGQGDRQRRGARLEAGGDERKPIVDRRLADRVERWHRRGAERQRRDVETAEQLEG